MNKKIMIWIGIFVLSSISLKFYAQSMITPIWLSNAFAAFYLLHYYKEIKSHITAFLIPTTAILFASLCFDQFQSLQNKILLSVLSGVQIITYIWIYRILLRIVLKQKYRNTIIVIIPNLLSTLVGSILVIFVPLNVDKVNLFFDYFLEQISTNYALLCVLYGLHQIKNIKILDYVVLLFIVILQSLTPFSVNFTNVFLLPFLATYFCIRYKFSEFVFLLGCMTLFCTITVNLPLIIEYYSFIELKTKVLVGDYRIRIASLIVVFLFFSELQKINKSLSKYLENISFHDALTELKNRRYMREKVLQSSNKILDGAILILDIDDFKKINDRYGHYAGDSVIREVAILLKKQIPRHDLIFRWGGEEYLILLSNIRTDKELALICQNLLKQVEQTLVHYENNIIQCTFSIGGTRFLEFNQHNYHQIIDTADRMLYQAKYDGKDCFKIAISLYNDVNHAIS